MSTLNQVLGALKKKGSPQRRELYMRHGAKDRLYGVSVADMKVIAKTIKGEHELACELYATGNYDAMYLAGMEHVAACKVPLALETIAKLEGLGRLGKKRKTIRC